jgi:hypothetical protein
MSFQFKCRCGHVYELPDNAVGKSLKCKVCGERTPITESTRSLGLSTDQVEEALEAAAYDEVSQPSVKPASQSLPAQSLPEPPRPKEYKVLSQKDKWFSGKFDPERLESAINAYAKQGWIVKALATASIPGLTGTRDEMIVLLER